MRARRVAESAALYTRRYAADIAASRYLIYAVTLTMSRRRRRRLMSRYAYAAYAVSLR